MQLDEGPVRFAAGPRRGYRTSPGMLGDRADTGGATAG